MKLKVKILMDSNNISLSLSSANAKVSLELSFFNEICKVLCRDKCADLCVVVVDYFVHRKSITQTKNIRGEHSKLKVKIFSS